MYIHVYAKYYENWLAADKVIAIIKGCPFMPHSVLPNSRKQRHKTQVQIELNDIVIEQVCSVKFLGVYIDEHLS